MELIIKKRKPTESVVYDTYWNFAFKRQNIFFDKINNRENNNDEILLKHKFTNAYRASDRVSQYLIREIIYNGINYSKEDILLRILLFKIFNKIETWELLQSQVGDITVNSFDFRLFSEILMDAKNSNETIYSGAYIMTSGKNEYGYKFKHQNHLKLIEKEILNGSLIEKICLAKSFEEVYNTLLKIPTFGNFLAYQYAIDINYSELTNYSEMEFIVPGPGAKDGIKKCFINFGDYDFADIIRYVTDNQEKEFERLGLDFKNLWGRRLQLIDCQNLFCETDKYARLKHPEILGYSNRKRIKQIYKPQKDSINYFYPPKWNLDLK